VAKGIQKKLDFEKDPDFLKLLNDIKTLVRSSRQKSGDKLPHPLRSATEKVVIHQRSISITDVDGNKVLVIPAYWIPLFLRLEACSFTRDELVALDWSVFDEEHTPQKRSAEIVAWAKSLGKPVLKKY
jgi:hypothetical protein